MTEKQKRFAKEYIVDCNATQAAIRAGYNERTAYSQGQRLLKNVEIENYIKELMRTLEEESIASAGEVCRYLTSVMRGEEKEATIKTVGGIPEVMTVPVSVKDKIKAAELLGKRYGLFTEKVELGGVAKVIFEGESELDD